MRVRLSIRGLIALILLAGFALAALRGSTIGWAAASILLALLALCTATLGATMRPTPERGAWLGFAIFGWAYFALHFGPGVKWRDSYGPAHFTTWAIDALVVPRIAPELEYGVAVGAVQEFIVDRHSGRSGDFFCAVAHSSLSVVFGFIGGVLGRLVGPDCWVGRRCQSPATDDPSTRT